MEATHRAPNIHMSKFKRTKIIATVGPSTDSYESILSLIESGANGLRLNFSHGTHDQHKQWITWIRKASKAYGKPVAIIQDLQGPKIRLGDFEGIINVQAGQSLCLKYGANYDRTGIIPVQYDISKKVKRGERLYMYDGKVSSVITSVQGDTVYIRVENDGILIKRKGINLPDTDFGGDIITKKDRMDINFGATQDIDYVALSFVQTAADMGYLRRILDNLKSPVKIIAKVETNAAIDNIEEIVQAADAIMIARGDLAVETVAEAVPLVQRKIIRLCRIYAKPSIVATQMLASMTERPEPTRAEVSDVATAVLIGADCVMLSDETASGKYPIEAVRFMKRVIIYTEANEPIRPPFHEDASGISAQGAIARAIINLANEIRATAIIAETRSGATALKIASLRPEQPLIVVTSNQRVSQQLAILFGAKTYVRRDERLQTSKLTEWLRENDVLSAGDIIVSASGQHPGVVGTTDTIKVRALQ